MQGGELVTVLRRLRRIVKTDDLKIIRAVPATLAHPVKKPAGELRIGAEDALKGLINPVGALTPPLLPLRRANEPLHILGVVPTKAR